MKRKLTSKQKLFADSYIKSGNATQSAIEAGYAKKTARSIGSENLTKPDIKEYIDEKMQQIADKRIMKAREALELLTSIARGEETETVYVPLIDGGVAEEQKEADLKTRITAVKEIIKRYPNDDQLLKVQLKRATAEADLAVWKTRQITGEGNGNVQDDGFIDAIDNAADSIWGDDDEN